MVKTVRNRATFGVSTQGRTDQSTGARQTHYLIVIYPKNDISVGVILRLPGAMTQAQGLLLGPKQGRSGSPSSPAPQDPKPGRLVVRRDENQRRLLAARRTKPWLRTILESARHGALPELF
ncbi:hypothetical protein [Streptomyces sp. DI166]|uniref:hypothetical protein n=1 Tax=Streptomyces sp. DI166 TaxID=1839783 RepID=UPI001146A8AC|nr:hypothetical protein [Streptomyces sp. DI166]